MALAICLWIVAILQCFGIFVHVAKKEPSGGEAIVQIIVDGFVLVVVILAALEIGGSA